MSKLSDINDNYTAMMSLSETYCVGKLFDSKLQPLNILVYLAGGVQNQISAKPHDMPTGWKQLAKAVHEGRS